MKTKFTCQVCDEEITNYSEIRSHILQKCGKILDSSIDDDESEETFSDDKFECENCDFTSMFKASLDLHKYDRCDSFKYVCDYCLLKFKTAGLLKRHKKNTHSD